MARILVIGGSRFMGLRLVWHLLAQGHAVTILNRGRSDDPFGPRVARLRADRSTPALRAALSGHSFDAAVDFAIFGGGDAKGAIEALAGRVGHYVFISSGQVYLVRESVARDAPLGEDTYEGPVMQPPEDPHDLAEWRYGVGKREAEDIFASAFTTMGFPCTALRLPMVEGERDPSGRLEGYLWRILDGGPVLLPDGGAQTVRHVYSGDVARTVGAMLGMTGTFGQAYNLCQEEMPTLRELVELLSDLAGAPDRLQAIGSGTLRAAGIRPEAISPFSTPWMSLLDPGKAQRDLGFRHTELRNYLGSIVAAWYARSAWRPPESYGLRAKELALLGA